MGGLVAENISSSPWNALSSYGCLWEVFNMATWEEPESSICGEGASSGSGLSERRGFWVEEC